MTVFSINNFVLCREKNKSLVLLVDMDLTYMQQSLSEIKRKRVNLQHLGLPNDLGNKANPIIKELMLLTTS